MSDDPPLFSLFCSPATSPMFVPGLLPDPSIDVKLSIVVKAAEDPISLDVLKKLRISETKIYIVNFLRFLGTNSLILS